MAIFAGLALLLFPYFGKARETGHYPVCMSNLKQIGLAFKQYTQDYDESFPVWQQGTNRKEGWAVVIQPYLKSTQLFQCPLEQSVPAAPSEVGYCDYFYNSSVGRQKGVRHEQDLDASQLTILTGDAATFSSGNSSNGGTITVLGVDGSKAGPAIAQGQWDPTISGSRHSGRAYYGFADGHVKPLLPSQITRNPTSAGDPTFRLTAKNPPTSGS